MPLFDRWNNYETISYGNRGWNAGRLFVRAWGGGEGGGEEVEGLHTSVLNNIESPRTLSFRASIYPHPWAALIRSFFIVSINRLGRPRVSSTRSWNSNEWKFEVARRKGATRFAFNQHVYNPRCKPPLPPHTPSRFPSPLQLCVEMIREKWSCCNL